MTHTILLKTILLLVTLGQISLYIYPFVGIFINAILILFFLFMALYDVYDLYAEDTLALSATFPAISLAITALHTQDPLVNVFMIYSMLALLAVLYAKKLYFRRTIFKFGISKYMLYIMPLGVGGGYILTQVPFFSAFFYPFSWPVALISIIVFVLIEELFFRALLQNAVSLMTQPLLGVIFTALFSVLFHATMNGVNNIAYFIINIISGFIYARSKSLLFSFLFNVSLNISYFIFTHKLLLVPNLA